MQVRPAFLAINTYMVANIARLDGLGGAWRRSAMHFEVLGPISDVETFATNGSVHTAEVHWYEAAGIGRRELKIKRLL